MSRSTSVFRAGGSLRRWGRRPAAVALRHLAVAAAAALPAVARGQSLVVDTAAGTSPYTVTGNATFAGSVSVGDTATGVLNQPGSTLTVGGTVYVGNTSTGIGTYNLTGTGVLVANASGGRLVVGQNGTGTFNQSNTSSVNLGTNGLFIGNFAGGSGAYNIADTATLTVGTIYDGYDGAGAFNQTGGTVTSSGALYLGVTNRGSLTISGGTFTTTQTNLGFFSGGTGLVTQTGGTFNAGGGQSTLLGVLAGSTGTMNLSGGTTYVGPTYVGAAGTGTVNQTGASNVSSTSAGLFNTNVGNASTGVGTYNLGGTATFATTSLTVGNSGVGTFNQTGGTATAAGSLLVARNANSRGTFLLSNGTFTAAQGGYVGVAGAAVYGQTGGTVNLNGAYSFLVAGYQAGATGTVDLSGGALNTTIAYLGYDGAAAVTQTGGTFNDANAVYLGYDASGTATLNVSAGTFTANGIVVGRLGAGTVVQSGGTINGGTQFVADFGNNAGATGTLALSGGTFNSTGALVGDAGTGVVNQTGGTFNAGASSVILSNQTGGVGTYNLSGGTLITPGVVANSTSATFNLNGGVFQSSIVGSAISGPFRPTVLAGGALFNTPSGTDLTILQPLFHDTTTGAPAVDGGVTKFGPSTLTLANSFNTYTGPTNVVAGTLRVNAFDTASSVVRISPGATLGGNGSVGAVVVAGTITAGPDAATVGNLSTGLQTWNGSGSYLAKLTGDTTANDRLVMSGLTVTATSGNRFVVNLTGTNASSATLARYVLAVDQGATTGDPFVLSALTLQVNGGTAPANYALTEGPDTTGLGGVDLFLVTAAPEPTSLLLVAGVVAPLALGRRRRPSARHPTPGPSR